jgi:GNAT superfamily N-acetyltransferase
MPKIEIRQATESDAALILGFITDLAIYEKLEHEVLASESDIRESLFGVDSTAKALVCTIDQQAAGYAVYFYNYSTWLGKPGLFLEDLYISPEFRGTGAGKAVLRHLAKTAVTKGCGRFEWNVIDWNEPAIQFYKSLGAEPQNEWVGYRLTGPSLEKLASD